ncbi:MAG: D-2-hydroxyacid dehydrogenase [Verrucomicrobiales bacterium]|nr:D-2-hydroxyacid dehydrogenase [Verrucomicrobiales bacterium]
MKKILANIPPDSDAAARLEEPGQFQINRVEKPTADWLAGDSVDAEILFADGPPSDFAEMNSLQFIQLGSVGYTQLQGLNLAGRGIRVSNARGVFDVPIAEWNIAMMINLVRDMRGLVRNQESGTWDRDARFQKEIRGSVVGIWGYGGIGRETARMGKLLGLEIHVMTRRHPQPTGPDIYRVNGTGDPDATLPDRFFTPDETEAFLSGLDFLILAMPLHPENEGIIAEAELAALHNDAFLLNPARGPLVKEAALLNALESGQIAGAALDTHYHYPMPPEHPLWKFPNVIMTPHISGSSGSSYYLSRVWDIFAQNLKRLERGEPLLNELTEREVAALG